MQYSTSCTSLSCNTSATSSTQTCNSPLTHSKSATSWPNGTPQPQSAIHTQEQHPSATILATSSCADYRRCGATRCDGISVSMHKLPRATLSAKQTSRTQSKRNKLLATADLRLPAFHFNDAREISG